MERCANCDRVIGNLETPHTHNENIVCAQCKTLLTHDVEAPAPVKSEHACPKCGSEETASFQMVYEQGASRSSVGGLTFGGEFFAADSRSRTALAARTAPPAGKTTDGHNMVAVIFGIGGAIMLLMATDKFSTPYSFADDQSGSAWFCVVVFICCAVVVAGCLWTVAERNRYNGSELITL